MSASQEPHEKQCTSDWELAMTMQEQENQAAAAVAKQCQEDRAMAVEFADMYARDHMWLQRPDGGGSAGSSAGGGVHKFGGGGDSASGSTGGGSASQRHDEWLAKQNSLKTLREHKTKAST